jgi:hypothetical protein
MTGDLPAWSAPPTLRRPLGTLRCSEPAVGGSPGPEASNTTWLEYWYSAGSLTIVASDAAPLLTKPDDPPATLAARRAQTVGPVLLRRAHSAAQRRTGRRTLATAVPAKLSTSYQHRQLLSHLHPTRLDRLRSLAGDPRSPPQPRHCVVRHETASQRRKDIPCVGGNRC